MAVARVFVVAMLAASCTFRLDGLTGDAPADGGADAGVADDLAAAPGDVAVAAGADLAPRVFATLALLAGNGAGYTNATGAQAQFDNPNGIAVDGAGNVYVADTNNAVVRKVDVNAVVTTLAGDQGNPSEMDGTGTNAGFDQPEGVAADGAGNLWVTDAGAGTIRRIVIATGVVTTFAGNGNNGFADGTGTAAQLNQPRGIVADGAGNLYVSDSSNQVIRKIVVATAAVTTLAGTVGQSGRVDLTGTAARFNQPRGLAVAGGTLYVADMGNSCIRAVALASAAVTTLAGTGVAGATDGVGTAAAFDSPRGVALDGLGQLFVADTQNSTIRRIVLATAQVTTLAGSAHVVGQQLGPLPAVLDAPWGIVVVPGSGALVYSDATTSDLLIIR